MILIQLHGQPGSLTGTLAINAGRWNIATWRMGGDPGVAHATTTDGERVTLALNDAAPDGTRTGAINVAGAPWDLRDVTRDGMTLSGTAIEPPDDDWLRHFVG